MTLITVLLGIVGLGIVVFFHELGHFLAARLVGIDVEEFSLGWGPKLAGFKRGKTLYRISVLPVGGYCRMKGEDGYRKALEQGLEQFPHEAGSYFAASPWRRIIVSLAGPFMNVVFAFVVFSAIFAAGYTERSWDNKIVLASQYDQKTYPADEAGLQTGDVIEKIDSEIISNFADIQEAITMSPGKKMIAQVIRAGEIKHITLQAKLDPETGAGKVGIYPWIEPVLAEVKSGTAAAIAGLKEGDIIRQVNGKTILHAMDMALGLEGEKPVRLTIAYERDGSIHETQLIPEYSSNGEMKLGFDWRIRGLNVQSHGLSSILRDGGELTLKTINGTYKGLVTLFMGVNVLKAVSGPARITWMVGQAATDGFGSGTSDGLSYVFNFLAILSIGLFVMNLLPIPLLDGGSIVLFIVEIFKKTPLKVKTVFRYQTIGLIAVASLFMLTTISDILFFSGK